MKSNFENEIWESLLKAAVIKNCLDEAGNYSSAKIEEITLPASYDYKMRRLIKRLYFKDMFRTSLYYIKKISAVLFILIGIGFVFLLHFDDVRAACHNVISRIYEKYILFDFHSDLDSEITSVRLGYIPKDFALSEEKLSELGYDAVYLNSQGDMLFFGSTPYKYISQADHEHYEVHDVLISHYSGQFFSSTDERFPNMLYWQAETGYYYLQAPLAEDEMIKIAENIK